MRVLTQPVFHLSEISESAKENARNWYRQSAFDNDWFDAVYEDAANIADIIGIDIRNRKVSLGNGTTRYDGINIGFSGFWSQGDGAHFEGQYSYAKGASKEIREYAPKDEELHRYRCRNDRRPSWKLSLRKLRNRTSNQRNTSQLHALDLSFP